MTAMDIRSTLSNVCRRVLHDTSVDQAMLIKRCAIITQVLLSFSFHVFEHISFAFICVHCVGAMP